MIHFYGDLTLLCYAASLLGYALLVLRPAAWLGRSATLLVAAGLALQYVWLLERSHWTHSIPYNDLYGSMLLFSWLLGITYLALEMLYRQRSAGAAVLCFLAVWTAVMLARAPGPPPLPPPGHGALFAFHVTLNTWAYAAFALSFILSVIYLAQNRMLRSRRVSVAFWRMPPLDLLDRMSRGSVWIGFATLFFGVISGLLAARQITGAFAWDDPKILITFLILAAYAAYLRLSRSARWRGARAALLCAGNFLLVLFSYTVVNLYLTKFHRFL